MLLSAAAWKHLGVTRCVTPTYFHRPPGKLDEVRLRVGPTARIISIAVRGIHWKTLPAVLLALGCGSEIVTQTGAPSPTTTSSTAAGGGSTSTSTVSTAGTGGTGGAPINCRKDSDCLHDEACRYTPSDGCEDPLPHCVAKMSQDSDCEPGQKWNDPSSTAWACLCLGDSPGLGAVHLECGTQGYPEPVSPPGRPCGPL